MIYNIKERTWEMGIKGDGGGHDISHNDDLYHR